MQLEVKGGWLDGSAIRKARKQWRCEYWRGKSAGGACRKVIPVGAYYVEGEAQFDAEQTRNGAFIMDKYCPECAGPEALASLPKCEAV